ncbi:MAG TPA: GGDEF domain-containing protein [Cyanobacteria bacterium UBA8156]|jgi:diguanylate cyclase (GGDEF)-like protein|nr:GGDEF domain-containing protein [Cyanobacteria bacterium UBA8156]
MNKPDVPDDDLIRVATLRSLGVLDTPPEERFDRLTRMARRLFGVPIALVSLVDENRQWFKSRVGLDMDEASRDTSFCGHAILGSDVFIIPNAVEDERFADNPVVVNEPHIRFYAGCPLRAPNGQKLGTLCIIDRQPRNFEKEDLEALVDLASMVEQEFSSFRLASMDELTNISNRRGFMLLAQHSLHFCVREKLSATLMFIDLDNFKPINDRFGHAEGDRALTVFADLLKSTFRDSDIVGRLGGDEFAVLLANHSKEETEKTVARLCQSLTKINQESNRGYNITFSYGVVAFDADNHRTIDALLEDGDKLMYQTKKSKK